MHSHGTHGGSGSGSMSTMSMHGGSNMFFLQKAYWAVIGSVIAVALVVHLLNQFLHWHRTSRRTNDCPARPRSAFFKGYATLTATTREISNSIIHFRLFNIRCQSAPLGKTCLVLGNLMVILVLCFHGLDTTDHWQWENVAYQTGYIAVTQLPLIVLLAGKRNIIGFLIGSSYERLNWLHRWTARTLFLTVTLHMGFWFRSWARYNYIGRKLKTDPIAQRGLAAWCILLWIFLTTFAPMRRWNYEFFVLQHVLTMIGFLVAVFLHLPAQQKVWVWLPIGLYCVDRLARFLNVVYTNLAIFHPGQRYKSIGTCEANMIAIGNDMSRIVIENPPFKWRPGQHVFLSCHSIAPLQSHPFSIASLPEDGRLELLVKCKSGATRRFFSRAQACQQLPSTQIDLETSVGKALVILDGPYGNMRPLQQFDSVFLIAGGSGGSFTIPLLRAIVSRWKANAAEHNNSKIRSSGFATRFIRFVWVVKSKDEVCWFSDSIEQVASDVAELRKQVPDVGVKFSIYLTCDAALQAVSTSQATGPAKCAGQNHHESAIATRELTQVKEVTNSSIGHDSTHATSDDTSTRDACGANGTCCCTAVIEDEGAAKASDLNSSPCHCASIKKNTLAPSDTEKETPTDDVSVGSSTEGTELDPLTSKFKTESFPVSRPSIDFFTGRPQPKNLIRTMLEQARGESAVVVCGPQGLNENVRSSVVALSDERAVHKGTGAQGIYFWEESFCY